MSDKISAGRDPERGGRSYIDDCSLAMEFPAQERERDTGHQVLHSQWARLALAAPWAHPLHMDEHLQGTTLQDLPMRERMKGEKKR